MTMVGTTNISNLRQHYNTIKCPAKKRENTVYSHFNLFNDWVWWGGVD